jgi:uncharacterized surface protein with fasciclin (FAS1) repeats
MAAMDRTWGAAADLLAGADALGVAKLTKILVQTANATVYIIDTVLMPPPIKASTA